MGNWWFLRNWNNRRTVKSILLVKNLLGLVQMTSGLVNASFSSPEWQAVKIIFFAPCNGNFFGRFQQEMQLWPCCFLFTPHIFSCGGPYDITQQVSEKHSIVFKSFKSIQSKITLTIISSWSNLNLWLSKNYFYPQICITSLVCIFHFFPGPGVL